MTMGRVAIEKNIEAFLSLDLPGSKVVDRRRSADGDAAAEQNNPKVHFLGEKKGQDLTSHLAAAESLSSQASPTRSAWCSSKRWPAGTPVAAFPVTGPLDVIADHPIGALDNDLRSACIRALGMSRETCRNFALERSWENSARQFIGNLTALQPSRSLRPAPRVAGPKRRAGLIQFCDNKAESTWQKS